MSVWRENAVRFYAAQGARQYYSNKYSKKEVAMAREDNWYTDDRDQKQSLWQRIKSRFTE